MAGGSAAALQGPRFGERGVGGVDEGRASVRDVSVERGQQLRGRLEAALRRHRAIGRARVELRLRQRDHGPRRQVGDVEAQVTQAPGLRVGLPCGLVLGHDLQQAPCVGHLLLELAEEDLGGVHVMILWLQGYWGEVFRASFQFHHLSSVGSCWSLLAKYTAQRNT
jgi:hypothetical protein